MSISPAISSSFAVRKRTGCVSKGLYPPRVVLDFEVIDGAAKVVKSGQRDLTDINYQWRSVYLREDYLRYEKDILRDWLRDEFSDLKSRKAG